jgi:adenylate cyclase
LCLDGCFATTIIPQPTEIAQFIFGQPLSLHGRFGQVFNVIGAAFLLSRRFDEALPKLLLATEDDPSFPTPYRYLAACYAHMGRLDEAKEVAARLRSITSAVQCGADCFRRSEHREFYLSGLRMAAGFPEE